MLDAIDFKVCFLFNTECLWNWNASHYQWHLSIVSQFVSILYYAVELKIMNCFTIAGILDIINYSNAVEVERVPMFCN